MGEHGPVIYKAMVKIGLGRLWEPLSSANEQTLQVTRDEFTKVFLSWLGVDDQFEVQAMSASKPGTRTSCSHFVSLVISRRALWQSDHLAAHTHTFITFGEENPQRSPHPLATEI